MQKSSHFQQLSAHLDDIKAVDRIIKAAFLECYPDADPNALSHVAVTNVKANGIVLATDSSIWFTYYHYRAKGLANLIGKKIHIRLQLGDGKNLIDPITNSLEKI